MPRHLLASENIAPAALDYMARYHHNVVAEVEATIASNKIVLVGMTQNPFVKKARKALSDAGVQFTYLEYGSYLSLWKPRLAIKLWSGWPTFPQVFVDGKLIGGYKEMDAALKNGSIKK
jgi:glutaredoxin-related protein